MDKILVLEAFWFPVYSNYLLSNIDQSRLSVLWLHAGKQSCVQNKRGVTHWPKCNLATLSAIVFQQFSFLLAFEKM